MFTCLTMVQPFLRRHQLLPVGRGDGSHYSVNEQKQLQAAFARMSVQESQTDEELEKRFQLCRSVAEECVQEEDLRNLLKAKPNPVAYDGFEPSGRMHIAQGVMKARSLPRFARATKTG